jgi:hypothetical protein
MSFQTAALGELPPADVTLKRLLSGMRAHMYCQSAVLGELPPADATLKRLLTGMCEFMSCQMLSSQERLPAVGTGIYPDFVKVFRQRYPRAIALLAFIYRRLVGTNVYSM